MADIQAIANQLSELTIIQMAELSKLLEEKWGVSAAAAAPVMMAAAGGAAAGAAAPVEEQTEFAVHLLGAGDKKINVIKVVREVTSLGLKEAKDLVDSAPGPVKEGVNQEEASDEVDVILESVGEKKIQVIKEVRTLTSLGLKEAKDLVEAAPKAVLERVNKETADKAKEALEGAGATVSYK